MRRVYCLYCLSLLPLGLVWLRGARMGPIRSREEQREESDMEVAVNEGHELWGLRDQ